MERANFGFCWYPELPCFHSGCPENFLSSIFSLPLPTFFTKHFSLLSCSIFRAPSIESKCCVQMGIPVVQIFASSKKSWSSYVHALLLAFLPWLYTIQIVFSQNWSLKYWITRIQRTSVSLQVRDNLLPISQFWHTLLQFLHELLNNGRADTTGAVT